MKNILKFAVLGLTAIASLGTVNAAGTLGVRSVSANWVTHDWQRSDVKSAYGGGIDVSVPVHAKVDILGHYRFYRWEQFKWDNTMTDANIGFRYHEAFEKTNDKLKLFVGGDLGNHWLTGKGYGRKVESKSWTWFVNTGLEYEVINDLSIMVKASYGKAPEISEEGVTYYTASANYWITKNIGLNASFTINEESDRLTALGASYRF